MANWYSTYFRTEDKDIVKLIKEGQTIDFIYNEEDGCGNCKLRYGLTALDVDAIKTVAENNSSSFIIDSNDIMTNLFFAWVYKDGKEEVFEQGLAINCASELVLCVDKENIINELSYILEELDARDCSNNCVVPKLIDKSWIELCDYGIKLFEQLKV